MIIFDARQLTQNSNGISNYSKYMLKGLLKNTDEDSMIVLRKKNTPIKTYKNEIILNEPINKTSILSLIKKNYHRSYINDEITFYSPDAVMPFRWCDKRIITIHDIACFSNADYHAKKVSKIFLKIKAYYATKIITVSEFSKSEIVRYLNVKADKVLVFPALNPTKSDKDTNQTELNFEESFPLLRRGNYFLFVGTIEPRKNLKLMVEGFINSNQTNKDKKLVIVGKAGWNNDLIEFVNNSQNDNVIWLQNTNDFEKDILMRNCAAFCYFSRYEGFGLPVLEALNLGCLVLTSDVGPIREYFSKYTIQINPNSLLSIKEVFENFEDLRHLKKELLKQYELEKSQFDFNKIIHNIYEHITNE